MPERHSDRVEQLLASGRAEFGPPDAIGSEYAEVVTVDGAPSLVHSDQPLDAAGRAAIEAVIRAARTKMAGDRPTAEDLQRWAERIAGMPMSIARSWAGRLLNELVMERQRNAETVMPTRTITDAVVTCPSHPAQWDAWTDQGEYLYLRFRHGFGFASTRRGGGLTLPDDTTVATFDAPELGGEIGLGEFCSRAGLVLAPDANIRGW